MFNRRLRIRLVKVPIQTFTTLTRIGLWLTALLVFVFAPVGIYLMLGRAGDDIPTVVSIITGLTGIMFILAAFAISRIRIITNHLGIEIVLRSHRGIAIAGVLAVIAHVMIAVLHTPGRAKILIPWSAFSRVRAAEIATVLLLLTVSLALTRARRKPRYEGWRLWHLLLAWGVVTASVVHIWLVGRLIHRPAIKWELLVVAIVIVIFMFYRWLYRPLYARYHSYMVEEIRREATSAVTLVLHAHLHKGVQYHPGQFTFLKVGHSPFVFAEHPFTVSSSATNADVKEITIKALGDFTEVVEGLRPGRQVYLDGPFGRFTTDGIKATGFVFIAGGVGITPMISMIRTLSERGDKRPALLIVTARTASEFMFVDELTDISRSSMNLTVISIMADPPEKWTGEKGRIDQELLAEHLHARRSVRTHRAYFVCGPPMMIVAVVKVLEDLDIPPKQIYTELFGMI